MYYLLMVLITFLGLCMYCRAVEGTPPEGWGKEEWVEAVTASLLWPLYYAVFTLLYVHEYLPKHINIVKTRYKSWGRMTKYALVRERKASDSLANILDLTSLGKK